jgi:transposase
MLGLNAATRIHLALGVTDMRKGFDGLASQVQTVLQADPFSGHLFLFRGRRGDLLKALWWDGPGLVLLAKRLEKGGFIWPTIAREGSVALTAAQLAMLLEGLDWRTPTSSWKPEIAV